MTNRGCNSCRNPQDLRVFSSVPPSHCLTQASHYCLFASTIRNQCCHQCGLFFQFVSILLYCAEVFHFLVDFLSDHHRSEVHLKISSHVACFLLRFNHHFKLFLSLVFGKAHHDKKKKKHNTLSSPFQAKARSLFYWHAWWICQMVVLCTANNFLGGTQHPLICLSRDCHCRELVRAHRDRARIKQYQKLIPKNYWK